MYIMYKALVLMPTICIYLCSRARNTLYVQYKYYHENSIIICFPNIDQHFLHFHKWDQLKKNKPVQLLRLELVKDKNLQPNTICTWIPKLTEPRSALSHYHKETKLASLPLSEWEVKWNCLQPFPLSIKMFSQ